MTDDVTVATSHSFSSEYTNQIRALERKMYAKNAKAATARKKEMDDIKAMKTALENGNKQVIRLFESSVATVKATSEAAMTRTIQNEKTMMEMQACMNQMARVMVQLAPQEGSEASFNTERERLRAMITTAPLKRSFDTIDGDPMEWNADQTNVDNDPNVAGSKEGASRSA